LLNNLEANKVLSLHLLFLHYLLERVRILQYVVVFFCTLSNGFIVFWPLEPYLTYSYRNCGEEYYLSEHVCKTNKTAAANFLYNYYTFPQQKKRSTVQYLIERGQMFIDLNRRMISFCEVVRHTFSLQLCHTVVEFWEVISFFNCWHRWVQTLKSQKIMSAISNIWLSACYSDIGQNFLPE
jgi:hypothetical protein